MNKQRENIRKEDCTEGKPQRRSKDRRERNEKEKGTRMASKSQSIQE